MLEIWSQMVARKYDELDIEKTPVEMYSYLEKFLGETARAAWEAYKKNFPADFARDSGETRLKSPVRFLRHP